MKLSLLVLAGSALGGLARFWIGQWSLWSSGPGVAAFPWATLAINAAGSLVIGAAATLLAPADYGARAFVMVGLCGGFTTFSAFSLQTLDLLQGGRAAAAAAYVAASVTLCLAAAAAGWALGRLL